MQTHINDIGFWGKSEPLRKYAGKVSDGIAAGLRDILDFDIAGEVSVDQQLGFQNGITDGVIHGQTADQRQSADQIVPLSLYNGGSADDPFHADQIEEGFQQLQIIVIRK